MQLTPDQQQEFAAFPPVLRALVEAELADGNSLVELGHGFPAPPVGAYVLLARKVSTRPRATGAGLEFYERNGSKYSGEFTDTRRFHFVLEPPDPPPVEPDMDAIRRGLEVKRGPLDGAAAREVEEADSGRAQTGTEVRQALADGEGTWVARQSRIAMLEASTPTGATWVLPFRDGRPPEVIVRRLERDLMSLFEARMEADRLVYRATTVVTGAVYQFQLVFESAGTDGNHYTLRVEASWPDQPETSRRHHRRSSGTWLEFWTRDFQRCDRSGLAAETSARYVERCEAALEEERELDSVVVLQRAIVSAMKGGATFSTSHKEGGTVIAWRCGKFISSNYGESHEQTAFPDEAEFLRYLRRFYDWKVSRAFYPGKAPEWVAWKLIFRLLER